MNKIVKGLSVLLVGTLAALTLAACNGNTAEVSSLPDTLPLPSGLNSSSADSSSESADTTTSHTPILAPEEENVSSETPNYSNYITFTENSANAPDINNITVKTEKPIYSTDTTEITVSVQNRTGWEMLYADEYKMERKDGDKWVEISMRSDVEAYFATGPLSNNQDANVTLDLTLLSESLSVGAYRISLPMICNGYAGTFYRSAEFSVK